MPQVVLSLPRHVNPDLPLLLAVVLRVEQDSTFKRASTLPVLRLVLREGLGSVEVRGHLILRPSVRHVAISREGAGERGLGEAGMEASSLRKGLLGELEGVRCGLREADGMLLVLLGLLKK